MRFTVTINVPTTPEIDPVANGVRVVIAAATGDAVLDVTIPGSVGWSVNRAHSEWTFHGSAGGRVGQVTLRRRRAAPGTLLFTVDGRGPRLAPPDDGTPVIGTIVLDLPCAANGQCGEAMFGSCRRSKSGKKISCG